MNEKLKVKSEKYKFGKFGGITLISLVITIVVLIILASVGIYLSLGNNGIFTRANEAKELTNKQTATEKINLKITTAQMNKYVEKQVMPTLKELSEVLRDDNEIQYVTEKSQIASTKYEVGENPTSIYTKLNDYPYEFEINSSLQLASINGVKISQNNNTENSTKVLFNGNHSNGTITFKEDKIEDYDYYEFIYGLSKLGTNARFFSDIVSKEFLQLQNENDIKYIGGVSNINAIVSITITNVSENSITCTVEASGSSWNGKPAYIYQIIGRNIK